MYHQKPLIGVKGRLQTSKYEDENKKVHYVTDVIAERVTFLSTNKKHEVVKEGSSNSKKAEYRSFLDRKCDII